VKAAAAQVITDRATTLDGETRLDARLTGVAFGGFPRAGNTYLCNNLSYVVGYAMDNPGRTLTLLQASVPLRGAVNRVPVRLTRDHRATPRVFLHWPSTLAGAHLEVGAEVLRAVVGAQLRATRGGDLPTRGDNARAELQPSGDTF
jgi:hypothetical protein